MEAEESDDGVSPSARETNEVLSFVEAALPPRPASVLEVGCGNGQLARRLTLRGYRVEAIDIRGKAVAAARRLGVDAKCSDLLAFSGGPFDAVVFTRSLHHIFPLDRAVAKARNLLVPGGSLLVDEFAHDEVDFASARWFYEALSLLDESGALTNETPRSHEHRAPIAQPSQHGSALDYWRLSHAHDPPLHEAHAMLEALDSAFELTTVARGPGFYRLFSERLSPCKRGASLLEAMQGLEEAFIGARLIVPTGLRVVAHRRD